MSEAPEVEIVVVPGAGSSGIAWERVAALVPIRVLPVPDAPTVPDMAEQLCVELEEVRPRVLVGASLGAMVALELLSSVQADAFVPVATGFGITVAPSLLAWLETADDVLVKVARSSLADPEDEATLEVAVSDLRSRGRDVLHRHLSALRAYSPGRIPPVDRAMVVWGVGDRSVPLADHLTLARRLDGVLAPVAGAGHLPFLENPARMGDLLLTARRWVQRIPAVAANQN